MTLSAKIEIAPAKRWGPHGAVDASAAKASKLSPSFFARWAATRTDLELVSTPTTRPEGPSARAIPGSDNPVPQPRSRTAPPVTDPSASAAAARRAASNGISAEIAS